VITETVIAPVHPGEILLEEFLGPLGVSQYQLAKAVGVPARLMPTRTISLNSPPARHHDFSDVDGSVDQSKTTRRITPTFRVGPRSADWPGHAQLIDQSDDFPRHTRCVKWSAPQFGQRWKVSADRLAAEAD